MLSQSPNPSSPPNNQISFLSSHYPSDIRLYIVNWLTEHIPQLLSTEQIKEFFSASQINFNKIVCLIKKEILKHIIEYPVDFYKKLSKYYITRKLDQFIISDIPCFIFTRCALCKLFLFFSPAEVYIFLQTFGNSRERLYNIFSKKNKYKNKTIFHTLARKIKKKTSQNLNYFFYLFTPRI